MTIEQLKAKYGLETPAKDDTQSHLKPWNGGMLRFLWFPVILELSFKIMLKRMAFFPSNKIRVVYYYFPSTSFLKISSSIFI